MSCPECGGELYVEDKEEFSGCEDGYVVMCFDCAWADKWEYMIYNNASKRISELKVDPLTQAQRIIKGRKNHG